MDYSMPLMSVFISFAVPGAVGIYWIFKSVISTAKQFILSRTMPLPQFTEEDYKAAEKEFNSKSSHKKSSGSSSGVKVRSLHHIDDDDYDQPAPAPAPKSKKKVEEKETIIEKAPLKEDKKESTEESCEDSESK